jgi:hypothetical protein
MFNELILSIEHRFWQGINNWADIQFILIRHIITIIVVVKN